MSLQQETTHEREMSVSVIIPTVGRTTFLERAIESVIKQSRPPLEVIVVIDGANEQTASDLQQFNISQLRVITLKDRRGAPEARNEGVRHSNGMWVAFLDDDDEWLPRRLESQLTAARRSGCIYPIVFSRVLVRTPQAEFVLPHRGPEPGESIDEYLFKRRTLRPGEVLFQTSNILVPRRLIQQVPFRPEQPKWQETDWLVRAANVPGTGLVYIPDLLSIWNTSDATRPTISDSDHWEYLLNWAKESRELLRPDSYSGLLLISLAREAAKNGRRKELFSLLREARRRGRPDAIQLTSFAITVFLSWVLPTFWIRKLRLMALRDMRFSHRRARDRRRNS